MPETAAATHTPAPWNAQLTMDGLWAIMGEQFRYLPRRDAAANARLIAAAPALLAAAQDVDAAHDAFREATAERFAPRLEDVLNAYTRLKTAIEAAS